MSRPPPATAPAAPRPPSAASPRRRCRTLARCRGRPPAGARRCSEWRGSAARRVCANAGGASTAAPAAWRIRVASCGLSCLFSLHRGRVHERGAAFLGPSQSGGQNEPARRDRQRTARSRRASAPAPAGCRTPSRTARRSRDRSPRRSGSWPCISLRAPSTVKNTWRAGLAMAKFIQRCTTWSVTTTASVGARNSAAKPTT